MKNSRLVSNIIRGTVAVLLIVGFAVFFGVRLMKIQIVDGSLYLNMSRGETTATQTVKAPRGEIADRNGVSLVKSVASYDVIIEYSFFPSDHAEGNRVIIELARLLEEDGVEWIDSTPISMEAPYEFSEDAGDSELSRLFDRLRLNDYATAENCIDRLIEEYEISSVYTPRERRIIAGVRYMMLIGDFSQKIDYVYARDVSMKTAAKVKELGGSLPGADISQGSKRVYEYGDIFPHGIGYVGPIYKEEYEALSGEGYLISDTLGKSGIEKAFESELRGENGEKRITVSYNGQVSETVTSQVKPGNTVRLTIDKDIQSGVQEILSRHIEYLRTGVLTKYDSSTKEYLDFSECCAGAAVVMEVDTGAILAMVSSPGYDINELLESYSSVVGREGQPLYNRATDGLYRPGSVMKTVTAIASLAEGIITSEDTFYCARRYSFLDIIVNCTGSHGSINVVTAIEKSCNIFFYQLVQQLGLDKLLWYQHAMGLGEELELEIGTATGYLACPDTFLELGMDWTVGQLLQAAIGQSEVGVTPLQMCLLANTIATRGERVSPYLVDSVWDFNQENLISSAEPSRETVIDSPDAFEPVIDGMVLAGKNTTSQTYSPGDTEGELLAGFSTDSLPMEVAIKTGTPQASNKATQNSTVVGFYPADDPVISFAIVVEGGEYAKYMVRDIVSLCMGYESGVEELSNGRLKSVCVVGEGSGLEN